MKYYKFLESDLTSPFQGFKYSMEWTKPVTKLSVCGKGYHVCSLEHLKYWVNSDDYIWEVETSNECIKNYDKTVFSSIKLKKLVYNPQTDEEKVKKIFKKHFAKYIKRSTRRLEAIYPKNKAIKLILSSRKNKNKINALRAFDCILENKEALEELLS